jgi:hypothetical protein
MIRRMHAPIRQTLKTSALISQLSKALTTASKWRQPAINMARVCAFNGL